MLTTAMLMLLATTMMVASPAPVTRDTLEMGSHVLVGNEYIIGPTSTAILG